jgi:hypothetical protein
MKESTAELILYALDQLGKLSVGARFKLWEIESVLSDTNPRMQDTIRRELDYLNNGERGIYGLGLQTIAVDGRPGWREIVWLVLPGGRGK